MFSTRYQYFLNVYLWIPVALRYGIWNPVSVRHSSIRDRHQLRSRYRSNIECVVRRSTMSRGSRRPAAAEALFVARSTGWNTYPKSSSA